MLNPWFTLSFKAFQLGIEAQSVVALRMMRLASGGAGTRAEMGRMIQEKAAAVAEAQFTNAALGGWARSVANDSASPSHVRTAPLFHAGVVYSSAGDWRVPLPSVSADQPDRQSVWPQQLFPAARFFQGWWGY